MAAWSGHNSARDRKLWGLYFHRDPVLVSQGRHNELSKIECLNIAKVDFLTVLKAGSLKSRRRQSHIFSPKALDRFFLYLSSSGVFWPMLGILWFACLCLHFTWHSPPPVCLCLNFPSPQKVHPIQCDPLNSILPARLYFHIRSHSQVLGVRP